MLEYFKPQASPESFNIVYYLLFCLSFCLLHLHASHFLFFRHCEGSCDAVTVARQQAFSVEACRSIRLIPQAVMAHGALLPWCLLSTMQTFCIEHLSKHSIVMTTHQRGNWDDPQAKAVRKTAGEGNRVRASLSHPLSSQLVPEQRTAVLCSSLFHKAQYQMTNIYLAALVEQRKYRSIINSTLYS